MDSMSLTLGLVLIVAGFLLMAAELFVPSGGILFVLSQLYPVTVAALAGGVMLLIAYAFALKRMNLLRASEIHQFS